MLDIAKRTAIGAGALIIIPLIVWFSGWHWHPTGHPDWLKLMYWITETVTRPWGIITHVVLFAWFLWCLRFRLKPAIVLFAILGAAIAIGQYTKSFIKEQVQEPRPYVVWLEETHRVPASEFYTLDRKARGQVVHEQLKDNTDIPGWLRDEQSHAARDALAAGSGRGYAYLLAAGDAGNLDCPAFMRPADAAGPGAARNC